MAEGGRSTIYPAEYIELQIQRCLKLDCKFCLAGVRRIFQVQIPLTAEYFFSNVVI